MPRTGKKGRRDASFFLPVKKRRPPASFGHLFFSSFFFIWKSFCRYSTASESSQMITP